MKRKITKKLTLLLVILNIVSTVVIPIKAEYVLENKSELETIEDNIVFIDEPITAMETDTELELIKGEEEKMYNSTYNIVIILLVVIFILFFVWFNKERD